MGNNPVKKGLIFLWASFFLFTGHSGFTQESDRLILVQKTDSFNLFFLQPIDTKGKGVKIKYDATFIENIPECTPEMVLRATFMFQDPVEKISDAKMWLEDSYCADSWKMLNFSVVNGKYRYRLEFAFNSQLASKLLSEQAKEIQFQVNNNSISVNLGIDNEDKSLIRSIIGNNSRCLLLDL